MRQYCYNSSGLIVQNDNMARNSSARVLLDDLDRQLIAHLRVDGRAPLSRLAEALGVSRGTVQNRLDRLVASGAVLGFTLRLHEDHDDGEVRAVMLIEVIGKSTAQVIRRLRGIPAVAALHSTNGNWDLIAEIRVASLSEFDEVLREIRMTDGVLNSETNLMLSAIFG